jgi:AbrB family looped-hinge helix DNA binding protein
MYRMSVTQKGQLVIPKELRDRHGIKPNSEVVFGRCIRRSSGENPQPRLVTGDPEFELLDQNREVSILWLPGKPKRR